MMKKVFNKSAFKRGRTFNFNNDNEVDRSRFNLVF